MSEMQKLYNRQWDVLAAWQPPPDRESEFKEQTRPLYEDLGSDISREMVQKMKELVKEFGGNPDELLQKQNAI